MSGLMWLRFVDAGNELATSAWTNSVGCVTHGGSAISSSVALYSSSCTGKAFRRLRQPGGHASLQQCKYKPQPGKRRMQLHVNQTN